MAFQISTTLLFVLHLRHFRRVHDCAINFRLISLVVQDLRASPDLYRYTVGICLESRLLLVA